MPRKRKTHIKPEQCAQCGIFITRNSTLCKPCYLSKIKGRTLVSQRKFDPAPEELERLIWEMPATKVGEHFEVSGRAIKKRCRKYGIETPGRGYWAKKRSGKI